MTKRTKTLKSDTHPHGEAKPAALITGGSRGLGRALALALADRGWNLALVARGEQALAQTVLEARARGAQAHAIVADIGDKNAVHRIAHEAQALVGPIELLVNAASILGPTPLRLLLDTECEDLEQVLAVNLLGPFRLTKLIAPGMVLRGHGTVLNVSSDAAVEAYETWGAYGLSKAALDHLTRTFAAELAGTGVRFASVDPGEMATQMHADAIPEADPATLADPSKVALRILNLLDGERPAENGARVQAHEWEAAS